MVPGTVGLFAHPSIFAEELKLGILNGDAALLLLADSRFFCISNRPKGENDAILVLVLALGSIGLKLVKQENLPLGAYLLLSLSTEYDFLFFETAAIRAVSTGLQLLKGTVVS